MSTARQAAIAAESASIEASQSRAIAAREAESRPRNALEAMAARLEITPGGLKKTLLNTVFAECKNEEQFMALVVVSNAYGLNPLTKEIYAFPAKGGGIVPMVSVDGWIRLMNEHPQFDGIEFEYTLDKNGNTVAIESIIYRKDRQRPVKVMEFMEECKGSTVPWTKSPRRMLRHRALIQGVRVAFGFSGIAAEGEEEIVEAQYREVEPMPSRKSLAEGGATSGTSYNEETGEIRDEPARDDRGMTVVDEETERALDQANDGTLSAENPSAAEGPADEDRGEAVEDDRPAWSDFVESIKARIAAAKTKTELGPVDADFLKQSGALPDEVAQEVEGLFAEKRRELA